ncbi:MAG: COX15/CtaA family protein [Rhodospirillales bacterium]|nr:COX15/CtaA family protein [Rhodospirillales bacterium]
MCSSGRSFVYIRVAPTAGNVKPPGPRQPAAGLRGISGLCRPPIVTTVSASPHSAVRAEAPSSRAVGLWLLACCAMIFAMVVIGGVTRLTESGLSIVEWKPVSGALPPLTQADWEAEFAKYRQIDQYKQMNAGMSLAEFKRIFFWEWFHRLWGRLIGLVFLVPFVWFWWRGAVRGRLAGQLLALFCLGGLQGAIGWWMVASGLKRDMLAVSQYRLAVHLALALALHAGLLWLALDLLRGRRAASTGRKAAAALAGLVFLTIVAGAFVAGLDAGLVSDTFPLMDGRLVPAGYADIEPFWRNLFENHAAVQFNHRWLGIFTAACALVFAWRFARAADAGDRIAVLAVPAASVVQAALGIATLMLWVPVPLAAAHQAGAVILLTAAVVAAHALGRRG